MNVNRTTALLTGQLCYTVYVFKVNYILVVDGLTLSKIGVRKQISLYDTILKWTTNVAVALCVTILTPTPADTKPTAHLSSGSNANTCSGGTRFESRFRFLLSWPKSVMALPSASASVTTPGRQLVHQDRPFPGLLPCRPRLISRLTQTAPFCKTINKSKTI